MKAKKILWGYFVEILLSSLIVGLAVTVFGPEKVANFASGIGLIFVTLLGVTVLAAAFGMILWIPQRIDTPFYQWLERRGGLKTYLNAFRYVAFICVLSIVLVVFLGQISSSRFLAIGTLWVLILLVINSVTFFNNVTDLIRLELAFRKKARAADPDKL